MKVEKYTNLTNQEHFNKDKMIQINQSLKTIASELSELKYIDEAAHKSTTSIRKSIESIILNFKITFIEMDGYQYK